MSIELQETIHEQLLEYGNKLKEVEKEIVRKYRAGEDYSKELNKAQGLKALKRQCVLMMAEKNFKEENNEH